MSSKFRGTVGRSDLEGGYLTLTDGMKVYKLEGGGAQLTPGAHVEIEGQVQKDMMGIGFGAPVLRVKSVKVL